MKVRFLPLAFILKVNLFKEYNFIMTQYFESFLKTDLIFLMSQKCNSCDILSISFSSFVIQVQFGI